ncbi:unnamed protein product [Pedinophyceae sp. YPF-701]|nr:unnamed protein product [Pedinophyceae sp. YPF-701]
MVRLHIGISLGSRGPLNFRVHAAGKDTTTASEPFRQAEEEAYERRRSAAKAKRIAGGQDDNLLGADISLDEVVGRSLKCLAAALVIINKETVLATEGLAAAAFAFPVGLVFAGIAHRNKMKKIERSIALSKASGEAPIAAALLRMKGHAFVDTALPSDWQPNTDWLNRALCAVWPYYDKAVCRQVRQQVEPILNQSIPGAIKRIYFQELTFGDKPLRIEAARSVLVEGEPALDLKIRWGGESHVKLCAEIGKSGLIKVVASVKDIFLEAEPRVCFRCLTDQIPCYGAMVVTMMRTPRVKYKLDLNITTGAIERMITRIVDRLLVEVLGRMMVWPQRLVLPQQPPEVTGSIAHLYLRWRGVLRVRVLSATDLPKTDLMGSDPFVEVSTDPFRVQATRTVKNTRNPTWNQDIWVRIDELSCPLRVELWDEDFSLLKLIGDESARLDNRDLIGRCLIDLSDLEHNVTVKKSSALGVDGWLEGSIDENPALGGDLAPRGRVQLELTYLDAGALRDARDALQQVALNADEASPKEKAVAESLEQANGVDAKWQTGMLGIKAMRGRKLGIKDGAGDGKERVHVDFVVGSDRVTSPAFVAEDVVNFNYSTAFLGAHADQVLKVEVLNEDQTLGTAEVQIAELARSPGSHIHDVFNIRGAKAAGGAAYPGQLQLDLEWLPVTTKSVPAVTKPASRKYYQGQQMRGALDVRVVGAHLLQAGDRGSARDPYVRVRVGDETKKTFHETNTAEPLWNTVLNFEDVPATAVVEVDVFDRDVFSRDDPLGSCTVPVGKILSRPGLEFAGETFALSREHDGAAVDCGAIRLDLLFVPNSLEGWDEPSSFGFVKAALPPELKAVKVNASRFPANRIGILVVDVKQAEGLSSSGLRDYYVAVSAEEPGSQGALEASTFKSASVRDPIWRDTVALPPCSLGKSVVTMEVFARGKDGPSFHGSITAPLGTLVTASERRGDVTMRLANAPSGTLTVRCRVGGTGGDAARFLATRAPLTGILQVAVVRARRLPGPARTNDLIVRLRGKGIEGEAKTAPAKVRSTDPVFEEVHWMRIVGADPRAALLEATVEPASSTSAAAFRGFLASDKQTLASLEIPIEDIVAMGGSMDGTFPLEAATESGEGASLRLIVRFWSAKELLLRREKGLRSSMAGSEIFDYDEPAPASESDPGYLTVGLLRGVGIDTSSSGGSSTLDASPSLICRARLVGPDGQEVPGGRLESRAVRNQNKNANFVLLGDFCGVDPDAALLIDVVGGSALSVIASARYAVRDLAGMGDFKAYEDIELKDKSGKKNGVVSAIFGWSPLAGAGASAALISAAGGASTAKGTFTRADLAPGITGCLRIFAAGAQATADNLDLTGTVLAVSEPIHPPESRHRYMSQSATLAADPGPAGARAVVWGGSELLVQPVDIGEHVLEGKVYRKQGFALGVPVAAFSKRASDLVLESQTAGAGGVTIALRDVGDADKKIGTLSLRAVFQQGALFQPHAPPLPPPAAATNDPVFAVPAPMPVKEFQRGGGYAGVVRVDVIEGWGIASTDLGGKGDPYVVLEAPGGGSTRSSIIASAKDPVWQETFWLPVTTTALPLKLALWDRDVAKDDLIGRAIVSLQGLEHAKPTPVDLELKDMSWEDLEEGGATAKLRGTIAAQITWLSMEELWPAETVPPRPLSAATFTIPAPKHGKKTKRKADKSATRARSGFFTPRSGMLAATSSARFAKADDVGMLLVAVTRGRNLGKDATVVLATSGGANGAATSRELRSGEMELLEGSADDGTFELSAAFCGVPVSGGAALSITAGPRGAATVPLADIVRDVRYFTGSGCVSVGPGGAQVELRAVWVPLAK